jgi:hypothetical protein
MGRKKKLFVTFITLSLLVLLGYMSVFAQPIGIMSPQPEKPRQEILSSASGRFVFGQISDSSKDKFMLDTFSGRLWRIAETGEAGMFLRAIPYRTEKGEYSPLPGKISDSGKK